MRLGRIISDWSINGFNMALNQELESVEFCCNDEKDALSFISRKEEILDSMKKTGLPISSIGRWNHDVQVNGRLSPERMKSYIALLDTALELRANTFTCGINYDETISLYRNYCNAVEFFGALTERAKGKDIKVAVQNCDWNNFVVSPEHWNIILGENKDLCLKFDASHTYNRGDDYLVELSDWCERVAHVHIKGTVHAGKRDVDDPPAGMDDIRWSSIFAILYARGYDGDLSIEPHSRAWIGERAKAGVIYTRDFIRKFLV